jgi:YegS/Rv2252/BmrU family lipid kinase
MPRTGRAHFVVNPASGGGRTAGRVLRLRAAVARLQIDATFSETLYRGHGRVLAQLAMEEGYEVVVACGGDGTVNEVANAILDASAGDRVLLGTVPLGTGKDIGKCLGMPDARSGLRAVAAGMERRIDAGRVDATGAGGNPVTRYFLLEAAAGWVAEISASVPRWLKRLGDTAPYVLMTGVKMLGPMHRYFDLALDGERMDGRYNTVSIHNMEYWGGDLLVAPGAAPDDGLLDVIRWGPLGRKAVLKAVQGQQNGGLHLDIAGIDYVPAREISLDSPKRTAIDLDGEHAGYLPARVAVVPGAIRFLAPGPGGG